MSGASRLKLGCTSVLTGVVGLLGMGSVWAIDPAFERVESILQIREEASLEDREVAAQAASLGRSHVASPGAGFKIWCDAALAFPEVENLIECARFNLERLQEASNLVRPRDEMRIQKAQQGLVLLQAAEVLMQQQDASGLSERLEHDRACYREIIQDPGSRCR